MKTKKINKVLSMLLALVLIVGLLPAITISASAESDALIENSAASNSGAENNGVSAATGDPSEVEETTNKTDHEAVSIGTEQEPIEIANGVIVCDYSPIQSRCGL